MTASQCPRIGKRSFVDKRQRRVMGKRSGVPPSLVKRRLFMNCKCLGSACCRFAALLSILAFFAFVAGCGGAGAKGKMSGKVLYSGKPVTGGSVIFRPDAPSENTVIAQIDANGNYTASLPVGPVKIAVDNKDLQPLETGLKKQPRPNLPKGAVGGTDKPDPRVNPQKP